MEKFSLWNDDLTGINPFVVDKAAPNSRAGLWSLLTVGIVPFRFVLLILRGILLFVALIWSISMNIFSSMILIPHLRRFFEMYASYIGGNWMLFLLGVFSFGAKEVDATTKRKKAKFLHPMTFSSGDVIICNNVSVLQIIALKCIASPRYARLEQVKGDLESNRSLQLSQVGFLASLATFLFPAPILTSFPTGTSISKQIEWNGRYRRGPLVIFPEVETSNGKGILKFNDVKGLNEAIRERGRKGSGRVYVMVFGFDRKDPTVYRPFFWPFSYLFHLLWRPTHPLTITYSDITEKVGNSASDAEFMKIASINSSEISKKHSLKFDYQDKYSFMNYLLESDRTSYEKIE